MSGTKVTVYMNSPGTGSPPGLTLWQVYIYNLGGETLVASQNNPNGWMVGNVLTNATQDGDVISPQSYQASVSVPPNAALGSYHVYTGTINRFYYEGSFTVIAYSTTCANTGLCCSNVA